MRCRSGGARWKTKKEEPVIVVANCARSGLSLRDLASHTGPVPVEVILGWEFQRLKCLQFTTRRALRRSMSAAIRLRAVETLDKPFRLTGCWRGLALSSAMECRSATRCGLDPV
jgi:hypothetical protein